MSPFYCFYLMTTCYTAAEFYHLNDTAMLSSEAHKYTPRWENLAICTVALSINRLALACRRQKSLPEFKDWNTFIRSYTSFLF